jgi:hypothetical protein
MDLKVKVWNSDVRAPQPDNDDWEFHSVVVYEGGTEVHKGPFRISDVNLQEFAKKALGRYLDTSVGNTSEKKDLLANWASIESQLEMFFGECFKKQFVS